MLFSFVFFSFVCLLKFAVCTLVSHLPCIDVYLFVHIFIEDNAARRSVSLLHLLYATNIYIYIIILLRVQYEECLNRFIAAITAADAGGGSSTCIILVMVLSSLLLPLLLLLLLSFSVTATTAGINVFCMC